MTEQTVDHHPDDAEKIVRLRGEGPRVVRLSRKAVALASAAALALVGAAVLFALQPASQDEGEEVFNTAGIAVADGLASAPQDYSQVPRLGPVSYTHLTLPTNREV